MKNCSSKNALHLLPRVLSYMVLIYFLTFAYIDVGLATPKYVYKPGGSFTPEGNETRISDTHPDLVFFRFKPDAEICECPCYVQVYHITTPKIDPTTEKRTVLQPAISGLKELTGPDPHGGNDVKGYAVDTPFTNGSTGEKNLSPCYEGQNWSHDGILEGSDRPGALKSGKGYLLHFETAVICFDSEPYTILGSFQWQVDDKKATILKKKVKTPTGEVEQYDQGMVSSEFINALNDWIKTSGVNHDHRTIAIKKKCRASKETAKAEKAKAEKEAQEETDKKAREKTDEEIPKKVSGETPKKTD